MMRVMTSLDVGREPSEDHLDNLSLIKSLYRLLTCDDVVTLGAEGKRRGFKALKTNILPFDGETLISFAPGFDRTPGHPELNADRTTLRAVHDTLAAFRTGAGPDMGIHLDVNCHFKTEAT